MSEDDGLVVVGVTVQHADGGYKTYPAGRSMSADGQGDLIVRGGDGAAVAWRARKSLGEETELEYDTPPAPTWVATGLQVRHANGSAKVYRAARSFVFDGYGDLMIYAADGSLIATRRRASLGEEIELLQEQRAGAGE